MKLRKTTALILLFALSASLAGCGGTSVSPADTSAAPEDTSAVETLPLTDGLPDADLGGWTFSILNYTEGSLSWCNTRILVEELTGDVLNDAIYERNAAVMERFNCVITADELADPLSQIAQNVMAGDDAYDIYVVVEGKIAKSIPYTLDWHNVPHIQLDKPWWNPAATSVYEFDGKQTAVAGNMTLTAASRAVSTVFNKRIWNELGDGTDLYGLVKEGKWTLDRFIEISKSVSKDVDGDTQWTGEDVYGMFMGRGFKGYIASMLCGAGMNFTEKNAEGKDEFTLHENERGIDLVTKLVDAWQQEGYTYYTGDVHTGAPANFFENGHALFSQRVPNDIYKLRDMNDDIGILPMPKYDEAQENYCAAAWGGAVWSLSKTVSKDELENVGLVMEALNFAGYRDVIPVYKEIALKTKTARDNESEEMLDIIFDSIYFDFGTNIMYDAVFAQTFLTDIFKAKTSSVVVSSMVSALPQIEEYITDLFEAVAEME